VVRDRRYVVDHGVATSTGVSASIPVSLAMVEAIGGRGRRSRSPSRLAYAPGMRVMTAAHSA
jgi:transcriptional regulator GlxA family with amidase domain